MQQESETMNTTDGGTISSEMVPMPSSKPETDRHAQAVRVHCALWDPRVNVVEYDGLRYPIKRKNTNVQQFASVVFPNGISYVTQNLAKKTRWTDWVNKHPSHRLTWVFRGGSYSARVQEDSRKIWVVELGPDHLAYEELKEAS